MENRSQQLGRRVAWGAQGKGGHGGVLAVGEEGGIGQAAQWEGSQQCGGNMGRQTPNHGFIFPCHGVILGLILWCLNVGDTMFSPKNPAVAPAPPAWGQKGLGC